MLVALSMCLRVGAGIVWGSWGSNDRNTFSSPVGMLTEWLTGVSQVVSSRPDVFSSEFNVNSIIIFNSLLFWVFYHSIVDLQPGAGLGPIHFY